jgi:hypothetical protein
MDFVDEFGITEVARLAGRYGYLSAMNLSQLLADLAGRTISLGILRGEFRELLEACQPIRPKNIYVAEPLLSVHLS